MKEISCYNLYELLKDGEPVDVEQEKETYTFKFMGEAVGTNNYLSVTDNKKRERKFGWGWGVEQVWRALDHLEQGWETEQLPTYKLYNSRNKES